MKIAEGNEILVRGPNVMRGYYRDEVATREAFAGDWFHTGDLGYMDSDGYLYIVGRKKDVLKSSGGKYLSPERIETALERSVYILHAIVVGEGRPHPAALIAPDWRLVRERIGAHGGEAEDQLARDERVIRFFSREIRENTADLAAFEQIRRRFAVLPRELTVEGGELSPTLKPKRSVIEQRYAPLIDRIYALSP